MNHYREAWDLIDAVGDGPKSTERGLDTAIKLAEVMEPMGEFEATQAVLEEILSGASDEEDPARYARVHYWMGNNFGNMGRYDEARTHLHRALEMSRQSGNKEAEGDAHQYLAQLDKVQGYLKRALDHAEASVRCLRGSGNLSRLAWALAVKMFVLCDLKGEDDWLEALGETGAWVERSGNDRTQCFFLGIVCPKLLHTGQYEAAHETALQGLELAEKVGEGIQTVLGLAYAGLGALHAGKGDNALKLLQRGEVEGERVGHGFVLAVLKLALAEALLRLGRVEEARNPAEVAFDFCQTMDLGGDLQKALEINAEILASRSSMDETRIDAMMEQAAALVERSESPWYRIRHLMAQARIGLKRDDLESARENLSEARSMYREMGVVDGTGELRSIEDALRKEEPKRG
jgi:tetratricopeptide (TPR) repeat protein